MPFKAIYNHKRIFMINVIKNHFKTYYIPFFSKKLKSLLYDWKRILNRVQTVGAKFAPESLIPEMKSISRISLSGKYIKYQA